MKITQKIVLTAFLGVIMLVSTQTSVHAQANVSCNNANYHVQNYMDVIAKPNESLRMYLDASGYMKVTVAAIAPQSEVIAAEIITRQVSGITLIDTRSPKTVATTYRYTMSWCTNSSYSSCTQAPRWMPSNVSPHQYTCGTGCSNGQINYAVVSKQALYNAALAEGYTAFNLNDSGNTLFKSSERTVGIDTSLSCWNDTPGTDGADNDFNDMAAIWSVKTIAPPTTIPPTTVPPTTVPPTTVPPTTVPPTTLPPTTLPPTRTPSVTHTPEDTGFADDIFLYIGGALYTVGVIAFMGARVLASKKQSRR